MRRVTIKSAVNNFTGYGQLFCELFSGFERNGYFPSVRSIEMSEPFGATVPVEIKSRFVQCVQPEPWELMIFNPNVLPTPNRKVIWYTMYESTRLPKDWIEFLNKAEIIVVPCEWNKQGFKESGVERPIHVIPLGYSPEIFSYLPTRQDDRFIFGAAGRLAHGVVRKGVQRVIDLFQQAFAGVKDVELWVKLHPDCQIKEFNDPRIKVKKEHLRWHQLRDWFAGIDCFVSASTAEGFGLLPLQAMAMGRPVIGARYSGQAEYLTDENAYLVPFTQKPVPEYGGGLWADMADADIIKAMLRAYVNKSQASDKGILAAMTASDFTWDRTVNSVIELMHSVGAFE